MKRFKAERGDRAADALLEQNTLDSLARFLRMLNDMAPNQLVELFIMSIASYLFYARRALNDTI